MSKSQPRPKARGRGRPPKPDRLPAQVSAGVSQPIKDGVKAFQQRHGYRSEANAVAELLCRALLAENLIEK